MHIGVTTIIKLNKQILNIVVYYLPIVLYSFTYIFEIDLPAGSSVYFPPIIVLIYQVFEVFIYRYKLLFYHAAGIPNKDKIKNVEVGLGKY